MLNVSISRAFSNRRGAVLLSTIALLSACGKKSGGSGDERTVENAGKVTPKGPVAGAELIGSFFLTDYSSFSMKEGEATGRVLAFGANGKDFARVDFILTKDVIFAHLQASGSYEVKDGTMIPKIRKSCLLKAGRPVDDDPITFKRQGDTLTLKSGLFGSGLALTKEEDNEDKTAEKAPSMKFGCFVQTADGSFGFVEDPTFKAEIERAE